MTLRLHDNCIDFDLQVKIYELLAEGIWRFGKASRPERKEHMMDRGMRGEDFENGINMWFVQFQKEKGLMKELWDQIEERIVGKDVCTVQRVYGNAQTFGLEGRVHQDDGHWTFMYMPSPWQNEWGGGTGFYNNEGVQVGVAPYKEGRIISFPARLPHEALPISRLCNTVRYVVVFKTTINSYKSGDLPVTHLDFLDDKKDNSSGV